MVMDILGFSNLSPFVLVLFAVMFTWFLNNLGSFLVFIFPTYEKKVFDFLLGFSSGVMISASFWSLLLPAFEVSDTLGLPSWIVVLISFLLGGFLIKLLDALLPHLHMNAKEPEGIPSMLKRVTLIYLAMTLHHIPEGFAVGVAVGASFLVPEFSGWGVALAIGIQNIPEGLAVSSMLVSMGVSKFRSFLLGVFSGFSEVIGGILGMVIVVLIPPILPIMLALTAGAMLFVVIEEVIPESQQSGNTDISTIGVMIGFAVMMVLDNLNLG